LAEGIRSIRVGVPYLFLDGFFVERLGNLLSEWLNAVFPRQPKDRTEDLATEILEFGRMRLEGGRTVIIEVPQVAYHLRETPRHIRQSLRLLEAKGVAKRTPSKDHWKLTA